MTVSIRTTLARYPGVSGMPDLTWQDVARHIRLHCLNEKQRERRERAAERQRLYDGCGDDQMRKLIHDVLSHPDVRALRDAWVEYSGYVNPLKRVCNELATVYQEPATRVVQGTEDTRRMLEVLRLANFDLQMQMVDRLIELHHALAIGPRMRELPTGQMEPVLDVVTPATFTPIRDTLEPTLLVGLLFDNDTQLPIDLAEAPRYTVWTYHETFQMNSAGEIIEDTIVEHGLGMIPYLLITLEPLPGKLIDDNAASDLVAAHRSIWFLNVLHLKEAASATIRTVLQGDMSRAVRDQADDSRVPLQLPEGVTATTLDGSMEFSKFLFDAQQILEITAANRGIPPTVLRHGAVASAEARDLIREPLKALRKRRILGFRSAERMLIDIFAKVVVKGRPDLAFSPAGFSTDFAEVTTTPSEKEQLEIFEKARMLGLTNTLEEIVRRNPDLDVEAAIARLRLNILVELKRNELMRPLQAISGSMGATAPVASPPPSELEGSPPVDTSDFAEGKAA